VIGDDDVAQGLTENQNAYIRHRIAGLTQRESYLKAYPRSRNWKIESVDRQAWAMERNPKIYPSIEEGREQARKQAIKDGILDKQMILRELNAIGYSDTNDYIRIERQNGEATDVKIIPTDDLSKEQRVAIAGIKRTRWGVEIKTHSKLEALRLLGREAGMFGNSQDDDEEPEDDGFIDALSGAASKVWGDEE